MDKDTANKVLLAVCSTAKPGEYVILNRSELAKNLPSDYRQEDVDKAIMQLQASDYITVRYSDGDVFCLSVLTKGYVHGEKLVELAAQAEEHRSKKEEEKGDVGTDDEIEGSEETEQLDLPVVQSAVKVPWKKLFWVCAGASFIGGAIAGIITALVVKILL